MLADALRASAEVDGQAGADLRRPGGDRDRERGVRVAVEGLGGVARGGVALVRVIQRGGAVGELDRDRRGLGRRRAWSCAVVDVRVSAVVSSVAPVEPG